MRLLPRSLTGRLLVTAGIAIALALAIASLAIGKILEQVVMHGLDDRLDAQIALISRAARPDGTLDAGGAIDLPPFDRLGSGWAWEVIAPGHTLRSGSLGASDLPLPPDGERAPPWFDHARHRDGDDGPPPPRPLDGRDGDGRPIHYRIAEIATARGPIRIVAAAPRRFVERPLRAAMVPLLGSLMVLGLVLAVALLVQLRIGLRPLTRVTTLMAQVRAGRLRHIEVDEPTELLPLVEELNATIAANEQALARARGHVANLAHGLKTPLATLRLDLDDRAIDPEGRLAAQVARMEGQIRHHLGRARAAETGGAAGLAVPLRDHVADLVGAMIRIHADRGVVAQIEMPSPLVVRCDPQDLDELLGNLLDNAWRWARSVVRVSAIEANRVVRVSIADDGPGMAAGQVDEAMLKGRRLDERESGHGFGLAISRELAELHGGALELGRADLGGLEVRITLPRA